MTFKGIIKASRLFSTEEVVSFLMDEDETEYDDLNEPLVEAAMKNLNA